jgi:hypothetical protein
MFSKYPIELAESPQIDPSMIWTIVLIIIVVLFIIFGRRILLLIKGKSIDEDLDDENEFVSDDTNKSE